MLFLSCFFWCTNLNPRPQTQNPKLRGRPLSGQINLKLRVSEASGALLKGCGLPQPLSGPHKSYMIAMGVLNWVCGNQTTPLLSTARLKAPGVELCIRSSQLKYASLVFVGSRGS